MFKKTQKKLSILLALCLIISLFSLTEFSANEIMPQYNNMIDATINTSVDDEGLLRIQYSCIGYSGITTKIVMTTYVEKKTLGLFWTRIDLGNSEDEWIHTIKSYQYIGPRYLSLPSKGTYRITVTYTVYGSGGSSDEITRQNTITY